MTIRIGGSHARGAHSVDGLQQIDAADDDGENTQTNPSPDSMGGPRASVAGQPALPNGPDGVDYQALTGDVDPDVARILGRSALGEKDVTDALKSLGLDAGDTLADPKTKDALKQVQKAFGLEETGNLDMESLLAILEAKMAEDRRSSAQHAQGHAPLGRSGGGGGGGAGSGSGAGGTSSTGNAPPALTPEQLKNYQYKAGDVTPDKLVKMCPGLSMEKAREVAPHLNQAMQEAGINTPARQAAFIAQVGHESGNFRYSEEIASGAAYEGRRDLGNTQPGDGTRFKGRGYIQLTGRANYAAAGRSLGLDLVNHPELAARPENAARIAAWYWNSRGLNAKADSGDFAGITRSINGGTNGAADRNQRYQVALRAVGPGSSVA